MEYYRNLLKNNPRSLFRLVIGIIWLIFCIYYIADKIIDNKSIRLFDWFFSAIFALNGLMHIFAGLGTSIERFFGKAFIQIDTYTISFKLEAYKKAQTIDWQNVQTIGYTPHAFIFQLKDRSTKLFPITKLDISCISDMEEVIYKIADTKKIKYYNQPYLDGIHYAPPLRSKPMDL